MYHKRCYKVYYRKIGYQSVEDLILNATKKQKISTLLSMYQECCFQASIKHPNSDVKKDKLRYFAWGNVNKHIHELKLIYLSLSNEEKPTWISLEKIKKCQAALMPHPRCDFCDHCYSATVENKGYSHDFCDISKDDVSQSEFGGNSPKTCPLRKDWKAPFYVEQDLPMP